MEALSYEFRIGCPWELLYVDSLVIVAEPLDVSTGRLENWKEGLEMKGLQVNFVKTKVNCCRRDCTQYQDHICQISMWGLLSQLSVLNCKNWVHKQCPDMWKSLRNCKDFIYKTCSTVVETNDRFLTCITIVGDEFDSTSEFCYLGDVIGKAGGCIDTVTARI